jgi:hypothetical protein
LEQLSLLQAFGKEKILQPTRVFAKLWLEVEPSTILRYSTLSKADEVLTASKQKT